MNDLLLGTAIFVLGVTLGAVVLGLLVAHRHREARVPRDAHTERSEAVRSVRSELVEEAEDEAENDSEADDSPDEDDSPLLTLLRDENADLDLPEQDSPDDGGSA